MYKCPGGGSKGGSRTTDVWVVVILQLYTASHGVLFRKIRYSVEGITNKIVAILIIKWGILFYKIGFEGIGCYLGDMPSHRHFRISGMAL